MKKGFTLLELLIVIALIIITAGVSTDIIMNLVRSYSKTKITNEIEQAGNIALLKLEKELKTATEASLLSSSEVTLTRNIADVPTQVEYSIVDGELFRSQDGGADVVVIESLPGGVEIANTDNFTLIQTDPTVISIKLQFQQAETTVNPVLTSSVTLEQTVVLRGTYR